MTALALGIAMSGASGQSAAGLAVTATTTPSFSLTLDGRDEAATYTLPLRVEDTTGLGLGWKLTITSTRFATGDANSHRLAADASTVTRATDSCASVVCVPPASTVAYPLPLPAGTTPPAPAKLFNALAGTGIGVVNVTPRIAVAVPANSYAGAYTSTVTVAIAAGP